MRIAFFLYEGLTTLDIIGPHDVLSRLPEAEAISVGTTTGPFMADTGVLGLTATQRDIPNTIHLHGRWEIH
ncbi:MAG: hypothetical protein EBY44_04415 [Actinobacteria bacterium]|nr:hypothetical protein [Actinomycetota bacterium]